MTQDSTKTPTTPPENPAGIRSRARRGLLRFVGVFALFAFLSFVYMSPAMLDCHATIMGGPGDATAGGVWTGWQYQKLDVGPWPASTPYLNAPVGESLWKPHLIASEALFVPLWLLNQVTSPVCSWNLIIFGGFLFSSLAMFGFVRWLTKDDLAGLICGFAYGFSPFHLFKAQGHMAYLHSEFLVLVVWALFVLWKNPTRRSMLLAATAFALLSYTDGYYLLMAPVAALSFFGFSMVYALWTRTYGRVDVLKRLKTFMAAAAVALVLMAPIGAVLVTGGDELSASVARNRSELNVYSARPLEYLLPARTHPVFSKYFGRFQDARLHGSNYSEQTLFVGWSILALDILLLITLARNKGLRLQSGFGAAFSTLALLVIALAALLMSAPADMNIGRLKFHGPSSFIFDYFQFWRVYARFFLLVHVGVVAMAGIAFTILLRKYGKLLRIMTCFLLIGLIAFEFLTFPPRATWSFRQAPEEYRWLAEQDDIEIIAEYPLLIPPANEAYDYLTWQTVHGKRIFNSGVADGPEQPVRIGAYGLGDPQTVPVLRTKGVDLVLVHRDLFASLPIEQLPKGLKIERAFQNTLALRVEPGPSSKVALAIEKGFYPPEPRHWGSFRWMTTKGYLRPVRLYGPETAVTISFRAESYALLREVTITQDGREVWRGTVQDTRIEFDAKTSGLIQLQTNPAGMRGPGRDGRSLAIGISDLAISPK